MADNNKRKNNGDLTAEDGLGIAGTVTAQFSPLIGWIAGSMLVADLCLFGGAATALFAGHLKDKRYGDDE